MNFQNAQQCFDEAKNHISSDDLFKENLLNGLSSLAQGLQYLESQVATIEQRISALGH